MRGSSLAASVNHIPGSPAGKSAESSGTVFHIMRFSLHDGPGIRTTVFLKGCPLRCAWCHNPESQEFAPGPMYFEERCLLCGDCAAACPAGAIALADGRMRTAAFCRRCGACAEACLAGTRQWCGHLMGVSEVVREVERDLPFFEQSGGGVTLSGGEPLSQPDFAEALLAAFHRRRIHTVLDTCGFAQRDTCLRVARRADLILYDLKLLDLVRHKEHTGVSNELILENIEALAKEGLPVTVRVPLIPGVNDGEGDIGALADFALRLGLRRIDLLPYHRMGTDKYRRLGFAIPAWQPASPSPELVRRIVEELESRGLSVKLGGRS